MAALKTLTLEPLHGLGISRRIQQVTDGVFDVQPGSLFPALQRLEQDGWIRGAWGKSENGRRAKYYRLTVGGMRRLGEEQQSWSQVGVGQTREATAARLRAEWPPDQIRWRFYSTGAALCLLLDRFQPDWKARIDRELERTTADLRTEGETRRISVPPRASRSGVTVSVR